MEAREYATFLLNSSGLVTTWNAAAAALIGYSVDEVVGQPLSRLLVPEDQAAGIAAQMIEAAVRDGSGEAELRIARKDSTPFAARINAAAQSGAGGSVTAIVISVCDLTGIRGREGASVAKTELLQAIHALQSEVISTRERRASFEAVLTRVLELTDCEYGFIGEVLTDNGRPYFKLYGVSTIGLNAESRAFFANRPVEGVEFHNLQNLFGATILSGLPVIANDVPSDPRRGGNLPPGHPPLNSFLGVPLFHAGEMVGMIGLANRQGGYDEALLQFLQPLFSTCANILSAHRSDRLRQEAEEELRHSRIQWQDVLDHLPSVISVKGLDQRYLLVNREFERLSSILREDAIGRTHKELFPADAAAWVEETDARLIETHLPQRYESQFRMDDGPHTVLITKFPVRDGDGRITGIGTLATDIEDRIRAESALRASEARFRGYFETGLLGMSISTLDRRLLEVNDKMCQMTGYAREELLSMRWSDFTHPDDLPRDLALIEDVVARKMDGYVRQKRMVRRDGRPVHVSIQAKAIRNAAGEVDHIVALIEDLSSRRDLEDQLRQAQKMEAVGLLAGGVAHDFNNLLTVIGGHSTFLMRLLHEEDERRDHVVAIAESCERAGSLTKQLLAFSRKQVLEPRVIDLNERITESARLLRRLIGEDVELELNLDAALHPVKVDPGQIEQAVLNLAVNAREAMPRGGRLILSTWNVETITPGPEGLAPGNYVALTVEDTGTGIPPEIQTRIFEPFFTTKRTGVATGLGLSTVYGIVAQSGGAVTLDSTVGAGSVFRILLPAVLGKAPVSISARTDGPARGSETILLVEDEDPVRGLLRMSLQQSGYHVIEASGGPAALAVADVAGRRIDLLVTDVVMPVMSGRELAERLRIVDPQIKVLYISGYTDDAVIRHGIAEATDAFLQKPFNLDDLSRRVRELLDGS